MKTHVNVGWSQEFKLSRALLVYGQNNYNGYPPRHPFVTMHDVVHEDGEARLSAGQLVSPPLLRSLLAALAPTPAIEVLPEKVIARSADVVVWWSPARTRAMFFSHRGGDKTLQQLNGKRYPHPPLLFRASGKNLWIRALPRNTRPQADTKLTMAPYWNCYDNGVVCAGTMQIPTTRTLAALEQWESAFFTSAFSHAAGVTKHTRHPKGLLAMWNELQGKPQFPGRYLYPLRQTVEQFVSCDDKSLRNAREDG
jgi:PRTRC genetic system protein B